MLLASCSFTEGVQRRRLLSECDECERVSSSRFALLVVTEVRDHFVVNSSQWKLASQLAVELNDYSSIIVIMDNVDNDVPGIRVRFVFCYDL